MPIETKSIGATGRDYSSIASWVSDLNDTTYTSTDTTAQGECYDDSVFSESVSITKTGTNITKIVLTAASGQRHNGTHSTGVRINQTSAEGVDCNGIDNIETSWLVVGGLTTNANLIGVNLSDGDNTVCHHCIIHDNAVSSQNYRNNLGILANPKSANTANIHNNIVLNIGNNAATVGTGLIYGISCSGSGAINCNQNTVYNTHHANGTDGTGLNLSSNTTAQNNVACANESADFAGTPTTANNNASSDATAPGTSSLTSITTADQFESLTGGSEDLHLKSGADCIDAGADLGTTYEIDINGNDRVSVTTWDIGAHEFELSSSGDTYNETGTGGAVVNGTATVTAVYSPVLTITGTASINAVPSVTRTGNCTISASATISASGAITKFGIATLTGDGTISATPSVAKAGIATISGDATVTATGSAILTSEATITGTASVVSVPSSTRYAQATLTGTASINATGTISGNVTGSATISGNASITANASVTRAGSSTITGNASITADASATLTSEATITGTAALTATGTITGGSTVEIEAALVAYLNGSLSDLYPVHLPETAPDTASWFLRRTGGYSTHLDSATDLAMPVFQLSIRSKNYSTAITTSETIRNLLSGYTGSWSNRTIHGVTLDNESDQFNHPVNGSDAGYYEIAQEYTITYKETVPEFGV